MNLESEHQPNDLDDSTALACIDQPPYQKLIAAQLSDLGYRVHLGLFEEDVLLKLATYSYRVLVVAENFKGASLTTNPILRELTKHSGARRREHFVVLVSQQFATNDTMAAFVQSVDLIINIGDVANFKAVLRRGVTENNNFYTPFRETLKAVHAINS